MKEIAVLGASGMLGSMLVNILSRKFRIQATVRQASKIQREIPNTDWHVVDVRAISRLPVILKDCKWVINAIGAIPQRGYRCVADYRQINVRFPTQLASMAGVFGFHIIQIATDCVYSGMKGNYTETDTHDPVDEYGKSKSEGEIKSPYFHNIRCSVIGREPYGNYSLLNWFLSQSQGAMVDGYADHLWNGITTLQFAHICEGIITQLDGKELPNVQHIVPGYKVSKLLLLECARLAFGRRDITVRQADSPQGPTNRTLATISEGINKALWEMAGYEPPDCLLDSIKELAEAIR